MDYLKTLIFLVFLIFTSCTAETYYEIELINQTEEKIGGFVYNHKMEGGFGFIPPEFRYEIDKSHSEIIYRIKEQNVGNLDSLIVFVKRTNDYEKGNLPIIKY